MSRISDHEKDIRECVDQLVKDLGFTCSTCIDSDGLNVRISRDFSITSFNFHQRHIADQIKSKLNDLAEMRDSLVTIKQLKEQIQNLEQEKSALEQYKIFYDLYKDLRRD